jgi:anti-sigma factor RsiW
MAPQRNDPERPVTAEDIHAFVDNALSPEDARRVTVYLAENPGAIAIAEDYRMINTALQSHTEHFLTEPVSPAHLRAVYGPRPPFLRIAAAAALLALGVGIGWLARDFREPETGVLEQLAQASGTVWVTYAPDIEHPVELTADEAPKLGAWLTDRIGQSVPIPRMDDLGYKFLGGRLLTGAGKPAAMLMYEDADARRLVVYVSPEYTGDGPTGMHFRQHGDAAMMVWANGRTGFAVAGPFSEEALTEAAKLVRDQFSS